MSDVVPMKKEAVKIIPHNPDVERIFSTIATYSKGASNFTCELLKLKFAELIYLLLDSPYQKLILSFLLDAARGENPSISSVIDSNLYSSATINELAILSGRSLSSFKREFVLQYGEPPRSWIRKKKLERAAYLLETSDKTIEEIAESSALSVVLTLPVYSKNIINIRLPNIEQTDKKLNQTDKIPFLFTTYLCTINKHQKKIAL